ncbi:phosphopantetheine-binding protein [Streptomyces stramineus]
MLGVRRAGLTDDFFSLGGDSLLALRLLSQLRDAYGTEISIARMFDDPTVAGLAAAVDRHGQPPPAAPPARKRWCYERLRRHGAPRGTERTAHQPHGRRRPAPLPSPEGTLTRDLLAAITARKSELLAHLRAAHRVPRHEGPAPLSFAQERLWLLHQFHPRDSAYNLPWRSRCAAR